MADDPDIGSPASGEAPSASKNEGTESEKVEEPEETAGVSSSKSNAEIC